MREIRMKSVKQQKKKKKKKKWKEKRRCEAGKRVVATERTSERKSTSNAELP
jgi:hypothetical protein